MSNTRSVEKLLNHYASPGENPVNVIRELSRKLVLKAFSKGWSGPPYNMFELSKILGFSLNPNSNVVDGRITPAGKQKFIIEYNPNRKMERINFSIAHEIGHTLFPDCADEIRNRSTKEEINEENHWEIEFLCNVAASELLLPYAEFSVEANGLPVNLKSLKLLAEKYQASFEAVLLRYAEVIDKPCTIAIAEYNYEGNLEIQYGKSSKLSTVFLNTGDILDVQSIAYKALRAGKEEFGYESIAGQSSAVFATGLGTLNKSFKPRVGLFITPKEIADQPDQLVPTVNGDATQPIGDGNKIIVQVVNTKAGLGAGFGKAIAKRFPEVKSELNEWKKDKLDFRLGEINLFKVSSNTWVCQMLAQKGLDPNSREVPLKYWALRDCLQKLKLESQELNASLHMPAIGAGQAGGNWKVIEGMIYAELVSQGVKATVYLLHGQSITPVRRKEETLSLFDVGSL